MNDTITIISHTFLAGAISFFLICIQYNHCRVHIRTCCLHTMNNSILISYFVRTNIMSFIIGGNYIINTHRASLTSYQSRTGAVHMKRGHHFFVSLYQVLCEVLERINCSQCLHTLVACHRDLLFK